MTRHGIAGGTGESSVMFLFQKIRFGKNQGIILIDKK
jgi:hypothetical protein